MILKEHISILSKNKITWLRINGIKEVDKKIIHKKDKNFVAYIYTATKELKDVLLEYKYNGNLQDFIRSFKEVNFEMSSYLIDKRERNI
ncbi:hypothetical protein G8S55_11640 [Clostridium botulinum C]|uniref:DUF5659 domain-containing protein n=1 Tax=Clostridium botulinum TaxID=1491 RepID=UPI001E2F3AD6|nr:DUF5659 domain-containing protein [Clostridium botulinum]MCD3217870.1 hypothetical protein [Clostridium botulinum C]